MPLKVKEKFISGDMTTDNELETVRSNLQSQISSVVNNFAATVRSTVLTGYAVGTNTILEATDTVLGAFGKIQAQINNIVNNFAATVRSTVLTGYAVGTNTALAATDTLLSAFGKIQAQINNIVSTLADTVRSTVLTGYAVGTNTALAATDTVLGAFGKIQAQINNIVSTFAATVRSTVLTGYAVGTNTALAATDTVLGSFGKIQAQINNIVSTFAATVRSTVLTGLSTGVNSTILATDTLLAALGKIQTQITEVTTLVTSYINNPQLFTFKFNDTSPYFTTALTDEMIHGTDNSLSGGAYLVFASCVFQNTSANSASIFSIYYGATKVVDSETNIVRGGNQATGDRIAYIATRVTIAPSQVISMRARVSGGTLNISSRNIILIKVG